MSNSVVAESYSVPQEARKVFLEDVLQNENILRELPPNIQEYGSKIHFEGADEPMIPINWRFAESVSALKALEGTLLNVLLERKYGVEPQDITINTTHASLFIMSSLLWTIDPNGEKLAANSNFRSANANAEKLKQYFPSWDRYRQHATIYRSTCANIYKTKDSRFFHLHGSLNPDASLDCIGLPHDMEAATLEETLQPYMDKVSQIDSEQLQKLISDDYHQAGTICYSREEFNNSDHGKANAHVGLYEVHHHPNPTQPSSWWPETPQTSVRRPLAGLKILDVTRVIAAPAITRGLAELGASVMRVIGPHLPDYSSLHCDLNWGKWNACLDFRKAEDREAMRALILEADVVVQGYRPGVLDKYGFGMEDIINMCKDRNRGVIYVRENSYGWNGPWSSRTGWQPISDACCGISTEFGRAMGNDEPVTPVFPNSDYCTGISGVCGVLQALLKRAEVGGSYCVDTALNYYSQWLANSCGTYPPAVWEKLWNDNGREVFRHYHNMSYTLPKFLNMLKTNAGTKFFDPEFYEDRESKCLGKVIRTVKPVLQFPDGMVELMYNIGTRTNGVDQPRWPKDLMTEVVV
ncbi:hypothetical protein EMPG_11198 [Blastomyces silverae]|uniref:Alpha-methylacyl-CoA racemase n=1 Tax=Blastomyces silverae TaxID=2060906 RepID=A0A0H1B7W7_9EURO|nr:hypothetical protein EMPG_11198 [Blastomyces silverae]